MDLSNVNSHCSLREKQTILKHRAASCVLLLSKHVPTIGFDMETRVNEIHETKTNEAVMVARSNSRFKDEHRVFCSEQATRCIVFFSRLEPQMILSIFFFFLRRISRSTGNKSFKYEIETRFRDFFPLPLILSDRYIVTDRWQS